MTTIEQYFVQAELAQAAYGTLPIGGIDPARLANNTVKMSDAQAQRFAETYTVVDQYTNITGVSTAAQHLS